MNVLIFLASWSPSSSVFSLLLSPNPSSFSSFFSCSHHLSLSCLLHFHSNGHLIAWHHTLALDWIDWFISSPLFVSPAILSLFFQRKSAVLGIFVESLFVNVLSLSIFLSQDIQSTRELHFHFILFYYSHKMQTSSLAKWPVMDGPSTFDADGTLKPLLYFRPFMDRLERLCLNVSLHLQITLLLRQMVSSQLLSPQVVIIITISRDMRMPLWLKMGHLIGVQRVTAVKRTTPAPLPPQLIMSCLNV